jgi:hypothetical protein
VQHLPRPRSHPKKRDVKLLPPPRPSPSSLAPPPLSRITVSSILPVTRRSASTASRDMCGSMTRTYTQTQGNKPGHLLATSQPSLGRQVYGMQTRLGVSVHQRRGLPHLVCHGLDYVRMCVAVASGGQGGAEGGPADHLEGEGGQPREGEPAGGHEVVGAPPHQRVIARGQRPHTAERAGRGSRRQLLPLPLLLVVVVVEGKAEKGGIRVSMKENRRASLRHGPASLTRICEAEKTGVAGETEGLMAAAAKAPRTSMLCLQMGHLTSWRSASDLVTSVCRQARCSWCPHGTCLTRPWSAPRHTEHASSDVRPSGKRLSRVLAAERAARGMKGGSGGGREV